MAIALQKKSVIFSKEYQHNRKTVVKTQCCDFYRIQLCQNKQSHVYVNEEESEKGEEKGKERAKKINRKSSLKYQDQAEAKRK